MAYIDLIQIVLVVLALFVLKKVFLNQNENPVFLPPRPKRLPILGNTTDLPPLVDSPSTGEERKGDQASSHVTKPETFRPLAVSTTSSMRLSTKA
jgi:biopolymer transport protein ExbD